MGSENAKRDEAVKAILANFIHRYDDSKPAEAGLVGLDVSATKSRNVYTIDVAQMYNHPEFRKPGGTLLDAIMALSETFGTDKIDVGDGESNSGCETCDYGSSYGTVLTIKAPTKNVDLLDALIEGDS